MPYLLTLVHTYDRQIAQSAAPAAAVQVQVLIAIFSLSVPPPQSTMTAMTRLTSWSYIST
eukprot:COSAG06_NODE_44653_length_361_cov_1.385496_2_plen_59_part_01